MLWYIILIIICDEDFSKGFECKTDLSRLCRDLKVWRKIYYKKFQLIYQLFFIYGGKTVIKIKIKNKKEIIVKYLDLFKLLLINHLNFCYSLFILEIVIVNEYYGYQS